MIHIILFIITVLILFCINIYQCLESFVSESNADILTKNKDKNIFNRHPINDSLPDNRIIKYKNAYYYEYDNIEYENKLKETFKKQKCYINDLKLNKWKTEKSIKINSLYQKIYDHIYTEINNSIYLKHKNDNTENNQIQIVHDVINQYTFSSDNTTTFLDLDLILYRQSKNNGKHINLQIAIKNNDINVFNIKVLGLVNEDKIHMYPVEHYDKLNHTYKLY